MTKLILFITIIGLISACGQDVADTKTTGDYKTGSLVCEADYPACQVGIASYYNDKYTGKATASGEKYDPKKMTAAHREHAFGTKLKVTNEAGIVIMVIVNDRGPFARGRILDVSRAAAEKLNMIDAGWQRVRVETLSVDR